MPDADRGTFEKFAKSIDPEWIEEALTASGTATVRRRRLPAEMVIWLVLGMGLFRNESMSLILKTLDLVLPSGGQKKRMTRGAVAQARERLGTMPLYWLFTRSAQQWARESADRHRWRGLRVYGVDGSTVRVPDSPDNRAFFGGQCGRNEETSGYPLVRLATLMVLRSHLLAGASFGPYTSELTYARELWPLVPDDSLVCVDRGFFAANILVPLHAQALNRHWLTRAKKSNVWRVLKALGRGDELVEMDISSEARRKHQELPKTWQMRAIRYHRRGFPPQTLLTSLVDSKTFPAKELVALYHERWECELGYNEVKTTLLEREEAIRSQTPAGVAQELWGVALAYNLIRLELERTAALLKLPPTRMSFIAGLWCIRNELRIAAYASPGTLPRRIAHLREDLAQFVLPPRRPERSFPRAVKLKMSNYARKRPVLK
jgi:hypothetical protein